MKALRKTPAMLRVARRVIWFEEPERALADPVQFLAQVMVLRTVEDLKALRGIVGKGEYRKVLEQAPPGISTRDLGPTGIWFAAARPRRRCRCAPGCCRSGRRWGDRIANSL